MVQERIAVVGLGYVGLPLAVAFAERNFAGRPAEDVLPVIGYDINTDRIHALQRCTDATGEVHDFDLRRLLEKPAAIIFTDDSPLLSSATCIIVTVPTPVTDAKIPDLSFIERAADIVGARLAPGTVVVLESTVYPGLTEDVLVPRIEGPIEEWLNHIVNASDKTAAGEEALGRIDDLLGGYSKRGCPGIMFALERMALRTFGAPDSLRPDATRDETLVWLLHQIASAAEQRGLFIQLFLAVEGGWNKIGFASAND
ncbi:MAG: hypothetical protein Q7R41_08995, partial [Phycisphaerales bacterium]|nr:hypothetical protein [Phycisphaerales bacterium]